MANKMSKCHLTFLSGKMKQTDSHHNTVIHNPENVESISNQEGPSESYEISPEVIEISDEMKRQLSVTVVNMM